MLKSLAGTFTDWILLYFRKTEFWTDGLQKPVIPLNSWQSLNESVMQSNDERHKGLIQTSTI